MPACVSTLRCRILPLRRRMGTSRACEHPCGRGRAHVLDATVHQAGGGPNTSTALRPPKANEFDIACTTFFLRPTFGT